MSSAYWKPHDYGGQADLRCFWTGAPFHDPTALAFGAWVNQGDSTETAAHGMRFLNVAATYNNSDDNRFLCRPLPATPYTLTALLMLGVRDANVDAGAAGLYLRDSATGKFIYVQINASTTLGFYKYDAPDTWAGNYSDHRSAIIGVQPYWLRVGDDGVTRRYLVSVDGWNFVEVMNTTHSDFIVPDQAGYGGSAATGGADPVLPTAVSLLSWQETSP